VADIYRLLPRNNCRQCGRQTCLVFAAELRDDRGILADCLPLSLPENADSLVQIERLFKGD
jgi:CO dehydrogenase/acetyl-CoA synthase gamma subunit (corrinoid Fe-S protein)